MKKKATKKYFVYLLRCKDNSLYTGYTNDVEARVEKHNNGEGAKYTKYRRPVKVVYFEEFDSINDAMKREAQIKSWSKTKKEKLIKGL
ncbi:GIY-YIG nuclease family protein [Candidatus Parcubacteria bacterium]|nr:MAG: GIY-YIG nuclease family protein [Candidatus Parcubacteria bacterium]